jgi:hypothetical protein
MAGRSPLRRRHAIRLTELLMRSYLTKRGGLQTRYRGWLGSDPMHGGKVILIPLGKAMVQRLQRIDAGGGR